ncbi:MAG: tRNA (adenosine(37)-N6)-threonylcarbamoyltransferase complex transferase subunit TsaD [Patescibacteria group bacterium]
MALRKTTTILAIETSCDETGIAILDCSGGFANPKFEIRANVITSQIELHKEFGGVVPNIAKREHIKHLPILLVDALKKAGINPDALWDRGSDLRQGSKRRRKPIDALAVTVGPGLEPALWAGITFTQELSQNWKLPVVAANHMEGHIAAILLAQSDKSKVRSDKKKIKFPAIALLVSGGHTELVLVKNWLDYTVIGETVDDAAGEAFDKVARMLDLQYPGGPEISRLAETGNRYAYAFPRPMINTKNYNFSFSGLKTAVLYALRDLKSKKIAFTKNDVAASFEEAVVDVLLLKTMHAIKEHNARTLILGGGVAANVRLRTRMQIAAKEVGIRIHLPAIQLTTDNAAMIAASAYFHVEKNDFTGWKKLSARATMPL